MEGNEPTSELRKAFLGGRDGELKKHEPTAKSRIKAAKLQEKNGGNVI